MNKRRDWEIVSGIEGRKGCGEEQDGWERRNESQAAHTRAEGHQGGSVN